MDSKNNSFDLDILGGEVDPHLAMEVDAVIALSISIFNCIYKNIPSDEGKAEFREATDKGRDEIVGRVVEFIRLFNEEEVTLH